MIWEKLDVIGPECEISRDGQVRQKRKTVRGKELTDVIRKPYKGHEDRLFFTFRQEGKQGTRYLHILLAEAFVRNPNDCSHVICEDYDDPTADNVHWVTKDELPQHTGKRRVVKLSERDVEEIRELLELGTLTQRAIAARFNVHESLISRLKSCQ